MAREDSGGAWPSPLPRAYYARSAVVLARALVGTHLVCAAGKTVHVARIVETEAYCGPTDAACHARAGLTSRTRSLLGPAGHAYVFLVYGMHECFNVVARRAGAGHAVLVRAVEPITAGVVGRTDGPGRLTKALGITRGDDAIDLCARERIWIGARTSRPRVGVSPRVGVAYAGEIAEAPWRFFDADSAHVSRPPRRTIGLGRS